MLVKDTFQTLNELASAASAQFRRFFAEMWHAAAFEESVLVMLGTCCLVVWRNFGQVWRLIQAFAGGKPLLDLAEDHAFLMCVHFL